jgi:ribulose-bisphosphate carboxylase large chain
MRATLMSQSEFLRATRSDDIVATYEISSGDLVKASEAIAIGQSIGNPNVRLENETDEMWALYGAEIRELNVTGARTARVKIGYPARNFTPGSITHILMCLQGGQLDIDLIESCRLVDIDLPEAVVRQYNGPSRGVDGIREHLGVYGRPLIGGIVKPKTGLTVQQLADMCREMADGGVDFIKEDEILGEIDICPLEERVEAAMKALEPYKVVFCPCLTAPVHRLADAVAAIKRAGSSGWHYNIWGGLDAFQYVVSLADGMFGHYQKSGDRAITEGAFSIDFTVWCKLVRLAGADFIHVGMVGGYLDEPVDVMAARLEVLQGPFFGLKGVMPAFSCGATPGKVDRLRGLFGDNIMVSAGGAMHGHPLGSRAGAKAFRDAAEGRESRELSIALDKWGR